MKVTIFTILLVLVSAVAWASNGYLHTDCIQIFSNREIPLTQTSYYSNTGNTSVSIGSDMLGTVYYNITGTTVSGTIYYQYTGDNVNWTIPTSLAAVSVSSTALTATQVSVAFPYTAVGIKIYYTTGSGESSDNVINTLVFCGQ